MSTYATIDLSFEIVAMTLSLVGFICVFLFSHFDKREKKDFAIMLSLMILYALFNGLFTIYGERGADAEGATLAFRFISILIGCWFTVVFTIYLYHLFDRSEKGYKIWNIISVLIAGILTVLLVGNIFGEYFYSLDNGKYALGIVFFLIPALEALVWVVDAVLVWINRSRMCKQDVLAFYCYFVMLISAMILQCFFPDLSLVCIVTALAVIVLLFGEQAKTEDRLSHARLGAEEAKLEAAMAKERLLRSQVSPHFIYNALTAIQALPDNPEATKKAIGDFAKYLRQSLSTINENTLISFEKELENVKIYFRLEKIRFGDSLQVEYDIGEKDFDLPAMSVQILAENAVKHGVSVKRDGGKVRISTKRQGDDILISVEDDGVGFDVTKQMDSTHIGIDNVRNRVETMVGGSLTITSEPGKGTVATIRFSLFA